MKAGVVVQHGNRTLFVSAEQALGLLEAPRPTAVPGGASSLLWHEGEVLLAVPFAACLPPDARTAGSESNLERAGWALVCQLGDQRFALTGVEILASGRFEPAGEGIWFAPERTSTHHSPAQRDRTPHDRTQRDRTQPDPARQGREVPACWLEAPSGASSHPPSRPDASQPEDSPDASQPEDSPDASQPEDSPDASLWGDSGESAAAGQDHGKLVDGEEDPSEDPEEAEPT